MRTKNLAILFLIYAMASGSMLWGQEIQQIELYGSVENVDNEGIAIQGDRLYAIFPGTNSSGDGASLLTIVDLETLTILNTYGPVDGYPNKINVFGSVVVVDGERFFNVADDEIEYLGNDLIESAFNAGAQATHQKGNFLYRAIASTGFGVYDMTDPLNPVTVHEHDNDDSNDYPYGIYANDDYIVVCDIGVNKTFIFENGGDYSQLGEIYIQYNHPGRAAIHGDLLYTSRSEIYDISDPANPVEIEDHSYTGGTSNGQMKIVGDYLLITDGGNRGELLERAWVFDIADYQDIELIASFEDTLPSYGIDLVGGKIYVAFGTQMSTSDWDGSGGGHIKVYSTGYTFVPDDNFEQALIALGYDDTLDDYVVTDSISSVTSLVVYNEGISDLTGIEGFTALTYLNCNGNELTSLDVSSNTALTAMDCGSNQLTSLDVSSNTSLTTLDCDNNSLTSLDLSSALTSLYCRHNSFTILDVSANTALTDLK